MLFALVAKRVDHRAASSRQVKGALKPPKPRGDTCLLPGTSGAEHFRRHNEALEQTLERNLDGIALSVIHSQWLAEHALKRAGKKLLITFDSDLDLAERHLRRSYVGLDNPAFGQQLGMLVQYLRPQRQTVHSDRQFPGDQPSGADPGHPPTVVWRIDQ
ncbi:substrate-binding domain-containing protein [Azotobacter chroococcum]|uniref:substrate-binding domain-containing protein n=1 Tax=Azotobacter chroococcum TaxID=353 RepID=UPI001F6119DB|nr:substrate-binding domain-containing protein [Azotobacter chroococcum]